MGYLDVIRKLRTEQPEPGKTAKAFRTAGVICILAGIWNFAVPFFMGEAFQKAFPLPPYFREAILPGMALTSALCFVTAQAIGERRPAGKRLGQLVVVLGVATITAVVAGIFSPFMSRFMQASGPAAYFPLVFITIFLVQFYVPAYFCIRYLERLTVVEDLYGRPQQAAAAIRDGETRSQGVSEPGKTYVSSPVPFGLAGSLAAVLAAVTAAIVGTRYLLGEGALPLAIPLVMLSTFAALWLFNRVPSPFEKDRRVMESYTCRGSILLFRGSGPFFLLLYRDGLEVRVALHRYFIPYDRMKEPPQKAGILSRGLLIESDLPGVPTSIRLGGMRAATMIDAVVRLRNEYLESANVR